MEAEGEGEGEEEREEEGDFDMRALAEALTLMEKKPDVVPEMLLLPDAVPFIGCEKVAAVEPVPLMVGVG